MIIFFRGIICYGKIFLYYPDFTDVFCKSFNLKFNFHFCRKGLKFCKFKDFRTHRSIYMILTQESYFIFPLHLFQFFLWHNPPQIQSNQFHHSLIISSFAGTIAAFCHNGSLVLSDSSILIVLRNFQASGLI